MLKKRVTMKSRLKIEIYVCISSNRLYHKLFFGKLIYKINDIKINNAIVGDKVRYIKAKGS